MGQTLGQRLRRAPRGPDVTIFIYRTPAAQDVCHLNALFMFIATHTVALD